MCTACCILAQATDHEAHQLMLYLRLGVASPSLMRLRLMHACIRTTLHALCSTRHAPTEMQAKTLTKGSNRFKGLKSSVL